MRISVVTPSYNYGRFLEATLQSVVQQDGPAAEHIVIDDGSSDSSCDVLRGWPEPLRWWTQPNAGLSNTLNAGVAASSGDFVGWLNSDDFYLPWAFSQLRAAVEQFPHADVIYGDSLFITEDSRVLRLAGQHPFSSLSLRGFGPFVHPCAMFVRRSAIPFRGFDATMLKLMDWDLYLQLLRDGARFHYVQAPLGAFRRHDKQASVIESVSDRQEYERMYTRHGQRSSGIPWRSLRFAGHLDHAARKAVNGSYLRQVRVARALRRADARWFETEQGRDTMNQLAAMYPRLRDAGREPTCAP